MCMMPCGLQHTQPCLLAWTLPDASTFGTLTTTRRCAQTQSTESQDHQARVMVENLGFICEIHITGSVFLYTGIKKAYFLKLSWENEPLLEGITLNIWTHARLYFDAFVFFLRFPLPVFLWTGLPHWTVLDGPILAKRSPQGTQRDRCRSMTLGRWAVVSNALAIFVWDQLSLSCMTEIKCLRPTYWSVDPLCSCLLVSTLNPSSFLQQICVPKADEWTRFVRTLTEINENRDEAEELANVWWHKTDCKPPKSSPAHYNRHWLPAFSSLYNKNVAWGDLQSWKW